MVVGDLFFLRFCLCVSAAISSSPPTHVLLVRVCVCVCLRACIGEELLVFWSMPCLSSTLRIPFGTVGAAHA